MPRQITDSSLYAHRPTGIEKGTAHYPAVSTLSARVDKPGCCLPVHLAALYTAPCDIGNLPPLIGYFTLEIYTTVAQFLPPQSICATASL